MSNNNSVVIERNLDDSAFFVSGEVDCNFSITRRTKYFEGMCQEVFIHNQKKWKGIGKKLWLRN